MFRSSLLSRLPNLMLAGAPLAWALAYGAPAATGPTQHLSIVSPAGSVVLAINNDTGRLTYQVTLRGKPVIEKSPLGIIVDGVDLGEHAEILKADHYRIHEKYPTRGVHSEATNYANGAKITLRQPGANSICTLEVRAFDDGAAFRFSVPGDGKPQVPEGGSAFVVPAGSTAWHHGFEGHYEGIHTRSAISDVSAGEWVAPPLTIHLPDNAGYASITEAALIGYAGMTLQAEGNRTFRERLGHAAPAGRPFLLRYGEDEARRLAQPAAIAGTITTPWRVILAGPDLNTLVNSDIVNNLAPPPDPKFFPHGMKTEWIKPGRAVWAYLDGGEKTLEGMKDFSRMAGELGFEYNVIEGFWQKWSDDELRDLVDYSAKHKVRIWLWKHSKDLRDAETRRRLFQKSRDLGVAGMKIDFFDHEAKEVIDAYQAMLRDAAEFHLMVNFHGANKPTGEERTWPNELTREAVRGMEYRNSETRATHETTLPFTRLLAGPADYTPMHFGDRRKETSWAHQIASAAILTSPLLTFAANPKSILENPGVGLIKTIPATWDETRVLPASEIGELAAFARRSGDIWFLAVMNGPAAKTIHVDLAFLNGARYHALLVRDQPDNPAAIRIQNQYLSRTDSLAIELRAGGGFIGRFTK